jgi:hypothetical protein
MIFTRQYISTSPCKPSPAPHTPGHILHSEPHLRYNDQNWVCKVVISHNLASMIKNKFVMSKFQCHQQGKARIQAAPATLAVNGHGFTVKNFMMEFTSQYITTSPTSSCKPGPPHTPGHIIDSDPHLSCIEQNLVCELKISMLPTGQGQGPANSIYPGR